MKVYRFFFSALVCMLSGSAALFASDLAGTWNFVWQTPGGERRSALTLELAGENVTAKLGPEAKGKITGTFKEGRLVLSGPMYSAEAAQEGSFKLDGKLDAGELKGAASWNEHGMTFTARRLGLAGKWSFTWQTPGGAHNSSILLTLDGENVKGKMGPEGGTGDLTGSLKDGRLLLGGPITSESGVQGNLQIDGKVESGDIKGRATWNAYDMAFSATRAD